jgi:hypothetical protein
MYTTTSPITNPHFKLDYIPGHVHHRITNHQPSLASCVRPVRIEHELFEFHKQFYRCKFFG